MTGTPYPPVSPELIRKRRDLAPDIQTAFEAFSACVFTEGALPAKTKQLIAIAVAHVTQCPYCINNHTKTALRLGATEREVMEAIWVAAEMRAGATYAHSALSLSMMGGTEQNSAD
jgi:AhpD family alkylhydroperoxidase